MPRPTFQALRLAYIVLALLFTALVVYGSLVPFRFSPVRFDVALEQFVAGISRFRRGGGRIDLGVNFLLFVPIGYLWLEVLVGKRRRVVPVTLTMLFVVVACSLLSLSIEFTQSWFPPRVPSLRDVLVQLVGTAVGCIIWLLAGRTISEWLEIYLADTRPAPQIDWLLQAYLLGLAIYSVMPLDLTISPADLHHKWEDSERIVLIPFSYDYGSLLQTLYEIVTDALVFLPVGMLATSVYTAGGGLRRFGPSLAIGFAIVAGIELAQLFVMSRFTDTTDLMTGTLGVAAGIWIMHRWRGSEPTTQAPGGVVRERPTLAWRWLVAAALYSVVLIVLFWAPFDFLTDKDEIRQRLEGFFAVPLSAAVRGNRFGALTALLRKVLLFLPLGVLLALSVAPMATRFRHLALAVLLLAAWGLALGIELGQIVLPDRAAVFDDSLWCAMGLVIGAFATSRVLHK